MNLIKYAIILLGLFILEPGYAIHPAKQPAKDAVAIEQAESRTLSKKEVRQEKRLERRRAWISKMVDRTGENEIIVAVLLALFLGCLGIHRVYLGGSWLLILAYFFTFGGLFGILPLIDFIRLAAGGIDHYIDNNRFFAAFE
ncbi:MAG TPA: TM2 domain-containing protein [Saprospiraceae bacterium]|nr:TM2 domain-containing protein [Saprospiraceae bacterium]